MITKCKQPDGMWRYACDVCKITRVLRWDNVKNPCRCLAQPLAEVDCDEPAVVIKPPRQPPTIRTDCVYIIEPTGESVEQVNCGCPGNKMTSVWECELFGRVAPFAKGDPVGGVLACQKCDKYEKRGLYD